jgi:uncharacterized protein YjbJ (UPF0337 family)
MNRDRIEGNWKQFSGHVREHWGKLSGDEADMYAGKHDQLAGSVQERRGLAQEESERQLKDFLYRNRDWNPSRR